MARGRGLPLVSGTTGLSDDQRLAVARCGPPDSHAVVGELQPRRGLAAQADRDGGDRAAGGLRRGDRRDPPPVQAGCPVGHRAGAGTCDRGCAARPPRRCREILAPWPGRPPQARRDRLRGRARGRHRGRAHRAVRRAGRAHRADAPRRLRARRWPTGRFAPPPGWRASGRATTTWRTSWADPRRRSRPSGRSYVRLPQRRSSAPATHFTNRDSLPRRVFRRTSASLASQATWMTRRWPSNGRWPWNELSRAGKRQIAEHRRNLRHHRLAYVGARPKPQATAVPGGQSVQVHAAPSRSWTGCPCGHAVARLSARHSVTSVGCEPSSAGRLRAERVGNAADVSSRPAHGRMVRNRRRPTGRNRRRHSAGKSVRRGSRSPWRAARGR